MPTATFFIRLGFVLCIGLVIDLYAYQSIKAATDTLSPHWYTLIRVGYWMLTVVLFMATIGAGLMFRMEGMQRSAYLTLTWLFGIFLMLLVPKLLLILFMLGEDAYRVGRVSITSLTGQHEGWISRSEFLSRTALLLAGIPFAGIAYGLLKGKYDFTVHRHTLSFKNLPAAFDGYRIVQISDIHCGSFDNHAAVRKGVALVNAQKGDVILFTGDLVNNQASELEGWMDVFNKLEAPDGVFSSLGNHDYGDYYDWPTPKAKVANLSRLKQLHAELGYRLLLNESITLKRGTDEIALIGVENWGLPPFPQYGDLNKAVRGTEHLPFKILLSHDPSHWDAEARHHPAHIDLTLAGHTHGMQFGVDIPGWRWSPVKYRYPRWADVYKEGEQYLNVNRGFGYIGFPGRVGIWPEVTVITLRRE